MFQSGGSKTVTLRVTDANGTSDPASVTAAVKDLSGEWQASFNVQVRTYSLVQVGTTLTGTYTNNLLGGQLWPLTGSIDGARRRISLIASYPGESTVYLVDAVLAPDLLSFTGLTYGGSASNQILTCTRK